MTDRQIKTILAKLQPDKYGWAASLPTSAGLFLGQQIRINFETRPVPRKSAPPKPIAEEVSLATAILSKLPQLLKIAETKFVKYERDSKVRATIRNPHIWINREALEDEPSNWAFVIGVMDNDDFGYHIEFEKFKCVDVWAGD